MDLENWMRDVVGAPSAEEVEAVWDAWLSGEPLQALPSVTGVGEAQVAQVLRSRPPPSFGVSSEPVSGERCLWFAVEGLSGPDGRPQPMSFLVPPRHYAAPALRRACALVTRIMRASHPRASPCWDIVEDVDRRTCAVMVGRGFLSWTFDEAGEVTEGVR